MFAYIKGQLISAGGACVVIEANGIGYKIFIPSNAFAQLPPAGHSLTLHTSFVVRELAQTLYGFFSHQERDFFDALMGVTGVGPKLALALIGHLPLVELQQAIAQADTQTICRIPGIGKKGAERLVIEMRDKIDAFSFTPAIQTNAPQVQIVSDAMNALIRLGYTNSVAQKAVKKSLKEAPDTTDASALVAAALRNCI